MSSKPWFKFYPGDYLGDTRRLSQCQHGAYLLLMIDYYANSAPPPDDDEVLARVTLSASLSDWKAVRPAIEPFFEIKRGHWHHKRVDQEIMARNREKTGHKLGAEKTNRIRWDTSLSESPTESLDGRIPEVRSQKSEKPKSKTLFANANGAFDAFWIAYPKKTAKQTAIKAWKRISEDQVPALMEALDKQQSCDQWQRGIIPHPATWLNQHRWEDELVTHVNGYDLGQCMFNMHGDRGSDGRCDQPGNEERDRLVYCKNHQHLHSERIR